MRCRSAYGWNIVGEVILGSFLTATMKNKHQSIIEGLRRDGKIDEELLADNYAVKVAEAEASEKDVGGGGSAPEGEESGDDSSSSEAGRKGKLSKQPGYLDYLL